MKGSNIMKLNVNEEINPSNDWTRNWEELFYGAALRFLKSNKKYLVVGFDEIDDFNELFLDEMPNDNFFIECYEKDGYKAVAIFERNDKKEDKENPRNSLTYINSYDFLDQKEVKICQKNGEKVDVKYTGKELFRLTGNDGSYNGKISAKGDGSFSIYETKSDWKDHSHTVYDKNGNKVYDRPEGYNHPWDHRQKDYALSLLSSLSFEELQ